MGIEELKELLNAGKITQEQFVAMAKALDPEFEVEEPAHEPEQLREPEPAPDPELEKLVQRAVDRATNRLGNENKKLRQQIETIKKNHLTEAQAAELERQQRDEEIEEERKAFREEKNRWYAMKAIKAAGLDDGSENALSLVDYVMGSNEEETDAKVKAFGSILNKFLKAEVAKTFKQHGRNPEQGSGGGDKNPWTKENWNITQQMNYELTNPELAKKLKAAAGVQ